MSLLSLVDWPHMSMLGMLGMLVLMQREKKGCVQICIPILNKETFPNQSPDL